MFKRAALLLVTFLPYLSAQSIVSARSGLINFIEGTVLIDGRQVVQSRGTRVMLNTGSILMTETGRAEVLLIPGTYLRVGENSSIRMISSSVSDTRVELLAGSAILDSARSPAGDFVKIVFQDATIQILKPGYYRMDADPPQLRVYEGQAVFTRNNETPVNIAANQLLPLNGAPIVRRFTDGSDGLLDLWSAERRSLIASGVVMNAQLADPFFYQAPALPGYMPLETWGEGFYGFYPYGLYSNGIYSSLAVPSFGFFPPALFSYFPRYRYLTPFPRRSFVPGAFGSPSRTFIGPRPFPPRFAPRGPGPIRGVRPGGRR
jgi:hypothetical protein